MNNKSTNIKCNTPKTPGGISKSLLTPCRRVGLSRNWRKSGPSPFVSPLASSGENSMKTEDINVKKTPLGKVNAKKRDLVDENEEISSQSPKDANKPTSSIENTNLISTPLRNVDSERKYRSKTLLSSFSCTDDKQTDNTLLNEAENAKDEKPVDNVDEFVSKPVRKKSIKITKKAPHMIDNIDLNTCKENNISILTENNISNVSPAKSYDYSIKEKSPNNLTKECIVVIQRKINKNTMKTESLENIENGCKTVEIDKNKHNPVSQALFDSDSDEVPLSTITKKISEEKLQIDSKKRSRETLDEDDDFCDTIKVSNKVKKLEDKATSIGGKPLKTSAKNVKKTHIPVKVLEKQSSQGSNSFDDDDDFDLDRKKTILIRKTYDKITKPQRAKSTGSVTQKDIDDLKARIEMKKNMLLAKAMTQDTADLRFLVKKWKQGCQDALAELMDLMKTKFPEKQNMDYSEILQMLKIPSSLVGYDSDNDNFVSPTDASIILAKFT